MKYILLGSVWFALSVLLSAFIVLFGRTRVTKVKSGFIYLLCFFVAGFAFMMFSLLKK